MLYCKFEQSQLLFALVNKNLLFYQCHFVYIIKRTLHGGLKIWMLFSRGKNNVLLAAFVCKILFCHSKIQFISSRHRVISSLSLSLSPSLSLSLSPPLSLYICIYICLDLLKRGSRSFKCILTIWHLSEMGSSQKSLAETKQWQHYCWQYTVKFSRRSNRILWWNKQHLKRPEIVIF